MQHSHCDFLIAGGGPAGLAAAIALRMRGADVLLAEALRPPIDKACGEGLMPDSLRDLAQLGVEVEAKHGAIFHGIRFASSDSSVDAAFPSGRGIGVRRTVLHRLLAERAAAIGVRTAWGCRVLLAENQPARIDDGTCAYGWLIGADGHASRVRAWARLERGQLRNRRFGFRAHFRIVPWNSHVEVHWGTRGQAYVTPTGAEEICVSAMTHESGIRLGGILAEIPALQKKLQDAKMTSVERGCPTRTLRLRRVTRNNVALIGDASGSADAITGEGLGLAFRQALVLAEALDRGRIRHYERCHAEIFSVPQRMASLLLMMDRSPAFRRRAFAVLSARPALFQAMLAVHVGEQPWRRFVLRHGIELSALMVAPRFA